MTATIRSDTIATNNPCLEVSGQSPFRFRFKIIPSMSSLSAIYFIAVTPRGIYDSLASLGRMH
jgi:hypothetical protein